MRRSFATVARAPATLHLKTGQSFTGKSFGHNESTFGETVFSTSITSYPESMTDPSYLSQILVFTTPMIGNYGVPQNQKSPIPVLESKAIQCRGVIVSDLAEQFSHYKAIESLHDWCARHKVPGITGVDTRAITSILRNQGTTLGQIAVGDHHANPPTESDYWDPAQENLVAQASTREPFVVNPDGHLKIALIDYGAKANIVRSLVSRGASVTVLPWDTDFNAPHPSLSPSAPLRDQFDGLFLSNGPGDPMHAMDSALIVRKTIAEWDKPIFGICMGNQIIGLAAGAQTYRMRFGNRGHNQPVLALVDEGQTKKGRCYVTSQNHQYAIKLEDIPKGWEPFFINANDSSVEGIKSSKESGKQVWGVQFHPESAGGPLDTMFMFDDFLESVAASKASSSSFGTLPALNRVKVGEERLLW